MCVEFQRDRLADGLPVLPQLDKADPRYCPVADARGKPGPALPGGDTAVEDLRSIAAESGGVYQSVVQAFGRLRHGRRAAAQGNQIVHYLPVLLRTQRGRLFQTTNRLLSLSQTGEGNAKSLP